MAGIFGFYAFSEGKENPAKTDVVIRVLDTIIPFAMVELDAIYFLAKVKSRHKGLLPIVIISRLSRST